tara:strand:+ start:6005 stop:6616 length:612 start_codon:yes stop_codon:yes gene_type:complete
MRILQLNHSYQRNLQKASDILKLGGMIIYPTDTLYALGGDALSEELIQKVFTAKNRPLSKPLPIAVSDIRMMEKFAKINNDVKKIADKFLPGAVTLILKKKKKLPESLTSGLNKVAVRIPGNKAAIELIRISGRPLITTSANFTGNPPPISIEEVPLELGADLALDHGVLGERVPSTIVDVTGKPRIVREGKISNKKILSELS